MKKRTVQSLKEKYNDKRRTTIEEERMEILPEDLIKMKNNYYIY